MNFFQLKTKNSKLKTGFFGFTVIELVVTVGIFMAITAVVVANYPKLGSKLAVDLLAHDIAISTRQAQAYALSVRTPSSNDFTSKIGYGMHFEKGNKDFKFFADVQADNRYVFGGGDLIEQTYSINGPYSISKICSTVAGTADCTHTKLDVTFKRPNPEAKLYDDHEGPEGQGPRNDAWFCVTSTDGTYSQQVHIWNTGQIGILSDPCE